MRGTTIPKKFSGTINNMYYWCTITGNTHNFTSTSQKTNVAEASDRVIVTQIIERVAVKGDL